MAQFFSHLNGLTLSNTWGDLVRLLDTCLVNGQPLPSITSVTLESEENIRILYAAPHNTMLFQLVELTDFVPEKYNSAFRVIGIPSTTELVLRVGTNVASSLPTVRGASKIQSLGYEIVFRDELDVKRVYRAKNPTAQHPFIRVDESLASPDGTTGVYTSTYAKYAMVGLLEHMEHIDDYENPDVLQLPFEPTDPAKNWKITGTGAGVIRGWSRWYWSNNGDFSSQIGADSSAPSASGNFCIVGDSDAFNILLGVNSQNRKIIYGCGLFNSVDTESHIPQWFIQATVKDVSAGTTLPSNAAVSSTPLAVNSLKGNFYATPIEIGRYNHVRVFGILTSYTTGNSDEFPGYNVSALEIPFAGDDGFLRGSLKHVCYACKNINGFTTPTPLISGSSMYLASAVTVATNGNQGGVYLYLGELE